MKKKLIIINLVCLVIMSACENSYNKLQQTSYEQETQLAPSLKNLIVFAVDVSVSMKAIDRYSLSENGDIIIKSYVFDNDCMFYDKDNNKITLEELAKVINTDYSDNNKMTKCRIVSDNKLVNEVYILE